MFARIFALLPFVLLASASPLQARGQCNSGEVQCCNMQSYDSAANQFGFRDVLVAAGVPVDAPIGLNCSPLSVILAGGNSCTQQTVCCDDNNTNGLVTLGCTPININL